MKTKMARSNSLRAWGLAFVMLTLGALAWGTEDPTSFGGEPRTIERESPRKDYRDEAEPLYPPCAKSEVQYGTRVYLVNTCSYWVKAKFGSRFALEEFWLEPGYPRETNTFSVVFPPSFRGEMTSPVTGDMSAMREIDIRYRDLGGQANVFCRNRGPSYAFVRILWTYRDRDFGQTTLLCPPGERDRIFTFPTSEAELWGAKLLFAQREPI